MGGRSPHYTIILAAGEGTRMGTATRHKVCFPIDGQPAIHRAFEIYNKCGIKQHILVVGAFAGQVVETVKELAANGIEPPLWMSANLPGGDAANRQLEEKWIPRIRHLG